MTVERTDVYSGPYIANGVTTTFPFSFQAASVDEVIVLIDGIQSVPSDFTVTINPDGTGAVTFFVAPPVGQVFIYSDVLFTQEVNFENQGPFYQASVNEPIDRSALRDLWLRARVAVVSTTDFLFPAKRSGRFLAWNADGEPYAASGTGADGSLRTDIGGSTGSSLVGWIRSATGAVARSVADIFTDEPSIMDFIPFTERVKIRARVSTADLTPYFASAAASGLELIFPAGSYRIAGNNLFSKRVTFRPGAKVYRDGSATLGFSGGIEAPCEQIFYGFVYPQIDINADLTPWGWVDWFGTDANALETAPSIFKDVRLAMHDYVVTRTVIWNHRFRHISGGWGSAEGTFGTRIILTGAAAATQPVVQVGTGITNGNVAADTARRLVVERINTYRDGVVQPATSNRREDAVPGWEVKGWYEGRMVECFDFGSPIHYRVNGTCACVMEKCRGVRPYVGASNGHPDFYTAFVVGGYATSWGFIGANASIRMIQCETAGGVGDTRVGLYLYGLMGDTWIEKFEMSQLEYGILIDGAQMGTSTPITAQDAHQDVMIQQPVLDACRTNCIRIERINMGGQINISDIYAALAQPGAVVYVEDVTGAVSLDSGHLLGDASKNVTGVFATAAHMLHVDRAVKIKNCTIGIQSLNSDLLSIEASIVRTAAGGVAAVDLQNVSRSYIAPKQNGNAGTWTYGVTLDAACGYNSVDGTCIGYGSFASAVAANKVRYNGADARSGFATNVLVGITG